MKRVRKKRFPDETQNLKTLMRLLLLVVAAKLMLVNAKADGCYCRVESISLSTNWWKMGFVNPGWPTNPPEVFLQRGIHWNNRQNYTLKGWGGTARTGHAEEQCVKSVDEAYDVDHQYNVFENFNMSGKGCDFYYAVGVDNSYCKSNGVLIASAYAANPPFEGENPFYWLYTMEGDDGRFINESIGYVPPINNTYLCSENIWGLISKSDWTYSTPYLGYYVSEDGHYNYITLTNFNCVFSDAMLAGKISRLMDQQVWPTNWVHNDRLVANYLFGDTNHITASGKKSFYRPEVPDSQTNVTYTLQWEQVTQVVANNTTNTTRQLMGCQIIGTGDKVNPAIYDPPFFVDVPSVGNTTIFITAPEIVTPSSPLVPGSGP